MFSDDIRDAETRLDEALSELKRLTIEAAEAGRRYRHARARAWVSSDASTVKQREMDTEMSTVEERYEWELAEGLRVAQLETVRAYKQILSAKQTVANLPID
ncbi:MAG: hypothetical protein N2037_14685 [Acidimicrobiales bacterium]|nr:hypothetical protein [Acidimicrobiales bacterium]